MKWELPDGWRLVKLSEVIHTISNGTTIRQNKGKLGYKVTRIETISKAEICLEKVGYVELNSSQYQKFKLKDGDILFSHINSTKHLGKTAMYEADMGKLIHGMNLLRLVPKKEMIIPKYFLYLLKNRNTLAFFQTRCKKSVNQSSLDQKIIKNFKIPLPPLPTQKKIVAILEKAEELKRLRVEADKWTGDFLQSVFLEIFGDPVTNPKAWTERELGEVFTVKHGFAFKSKDFSPVGEYVLLTPGNFFEKGGYKDRGDKQKYFIGEIPKEYILRRNDLLLAMTEQAPGLLGSPILVPESDRFLHNQRLGLVELKVKGTEKKFLFHLFNANTIRDRIHFDAVGTKVRHTSPTKIEGIKTFLPPIALQNKFVTIVEKVEQMKSEQVKSKEQINNLFNALMQKAFKGELVA